MDTLKKSVVPTLIAVVVTFLGLSIWGSDTTVVREVRQNLGAVSSPDIMSPYFSFGGVRYWGANKTNLDASAVVCALQSPQATSTLVQGSVTFSTTTVGATTAVFLAKASTPTATTTLLQLGSIASGAQGTVVATTTATSIGTATFAPGTYFVVAVSGGTPTAPVGRCSATWMEN